MIKIIFLITLITSFSVSYSEETIQTAFENDGSLTAKEFHHVAKKERKELVHNITHRNQRHKHERSLDN